MRNFQRRNAEKKASIVALRARGLRAAVESANTEDSRQLHTLATLSRNALVIALCVCIAIPATMLAQQIVPGAYAALLPFFGILIAIDLLLISPRLNKLTFFSKEWFLLNGSRWFVIVVLLKLLSYAGQDVQRIAEDLPLMRKDLPVYLFTPQFLASSGVVVVVWSACRLLGQDLASLTWGEREMTHDPELGLRTDRSQLRQSLVTHVIGLGVLAALLAGGAQWVSRWGGSLIAPSALWIAVDLLIYFGLGLALIGHSQLTILRTGWLWERTPIAKNLVVRWSVYGAVFLIGLAVLAFVLPVGNVSGLLPLVNDAFSLLFYIAQLIAFLFVGLLQLLLAPLLWLLGQPASTPMPPPQRPTPIITESAPPALPTPIWYENLQTLLFFAIALIVLGYALRYVLMQHAGLRAAFAKLPVVIWLREAWRGIKRLWRSAQSELGVLRRRVEMMGTDARVKHHPPNLPVEWRTLPLRQQVAWWYAQAVQQARANGVARKPAQTPHEFAAMLGHVAPEAQPDVRELTQQFVDARYSQHAVQPDHVSAAERCVKRMKRVFVKLRQSK